MEKRKQTGYARIEIFEHIKSLQETGFTMRQIKAMGNRAREVSELPDAKKEELCRLLSGVKETDSDFFLLKKELSEWFSKMREVRFQLREQEEREEERYKRFDRLLREYQTRNRQSHRIQ